MINPEEIRQQAMKWWKPFLQSTIMGENFFPREIDRIGKVRPGDITSRFGMLQDEITQLRKHSKNETGSGYLLITPERNFRRTGTHELPDRIVFETSADYLHFTGKKMEYERFLRHYALVVEHLPVLQQWVFHKPLFLTLPNIEWEGILAVCSYFVANPRPNLYLRQLPVRVHTKFIEDNAAMVSSLLDFLIPDHIRDKIERHPANRYYLLRDEPLIRLRMLDRALAFPNNIRDLSIPLPDFENGEWACGNVIITENKMNFLTLPELPSTMAIWSGGGFMVSYLRNARWLEQKRIFYWGDIDEHGFQILHQVRSYYGQTESVLMDISTFESFREFIVEGERNNTEMLAMLKAEEHSMYDQLRAAAADCNRLEQEKIPQEYSERVWRERVNRESSDGDQLGPRPRR